ncbi:hypothetical protein GX441_09930 [bacterium]|nr:hypothetical protein [bacterium]
MIHSKTSRIVLLLATVLFFAFISCKKEDPLKEGDLVFCQDDPGEGNFWEPAKVVKVENETVTIAWDDTFMKDGPEAQKSISEVVKRQQADPKKVKENMAIIIHPPVFLYPYKGIIEKVMGDRYIVRYKSGSVERHDTVDITSLYKYK